MKLAREKLENACDVKKVQRRLEGNRERSVPWIGWWGLNLDQAKKNGVGRHLRRSWI